MNALVPVTGGLPVGTQQGNWTWDGQNWVCSPCGLDGIAGQFPFCPPPGFPPHGCPPWFSSFNSPPWYPGANAGVSFGTTPPMNAVRGHFWWNGSFLSIFDGAVWVNAATGIIVNGGGGGGGGAGTGTVIISSTPPGNPAPGVQWWNGTVLQMWDGVKWNIIGPGAAAGPVPTTTITFAISQPAELSIPSSAWTIAPLISTPQVDSLLGWDPVTHKYRPNKAGMYDFGIRGAAHSSGGIALVKNDSGTFVDPSDGGSDIVVAIASDVGDAWMQASGIALMNGTTDFVRYFVSSAAGAMWAASGNPVIQAVLLP